MTEAIQRLRIYMRKVARAEGVQSTEMTVDCPRTARRVFIDKCVYCGDSAGMVLDPTGEESFVRCNVGCDPEEKPPGETRPRLRDVPVATVMTKNVVFAEPTTSVEALASRLVEAGITGVPVVDPERGLVGIVSQTDLVRFQHEGGGSPPPNEVTAAEADAHGIEEDGFVSIADSGVTVAQIMSPIVFAVPETASVAMVSALMAQEGVHRVPVVSADGKSLAGIVSSLDILRLIARLEQLVVSGDFN